MTYTMNKNGNVMEIAVEGRLDTVSAPDLDNALDNLPKDVDTLVFDFSKLDYISSAGLRVLIRVHRELPRGGKTKILNSNSVVREVFSVTGLSDVIEIVE